MVMFISLFVSGIFIELGLFKKLEFIGKPLIRLANLPKESAITFLASFGSVLAGNTMLAYLHREKVMDRRQAFLTALLNGIPVYKKETFTSQVPIIVPALGIKVGIIYFLTFIISGIARLIFVISLGRIKLANPVRKNPSCGVDISDGINCEGCKENNERPNFGKVVAKVLSKQEKMFLRVCLVFVPMTFLMLFLINSGLIEKLQVCIQPITRFFRLPQASAVPIATYMFSPLAGTTSIGTLIREGGITEFQAVVASLLGGLLMLPIFTLRYSLAKYTAIFGFSLGARILTASTLIAMFGRRMVLLIFLSMI